MVAYMLGVHNFYKGEDKTPDDIVITIEHNEVQEDGTPKEWKSCTQHLAPVIPGFDLRPGIVDPIWT